MHSGLVGYIPKSFTAQIGEDGLPRELAEAGGSGCSVSAAQNLLFCRKAMLQVRIGGGNIYHVKRAECRAFEIIESRGCHMLCDLAS